ncbi:MAG TPA: ABC transporter substrate-binding protein [Acetobacteraceae bacterium]|nr:ABC transporter substrate-binding protein [Acetobacteraceae bacterium]
MNISRRSLIAGTAATLAAPAVAQTSGNTRLLRFIPQADLTVLDPMWTTAYVTRNHGYMVFDTLFGLDSQYKPSPQMLAGFNTEQDGKQWTLGLRSGLKFHDGEPVRAQDCVASITRWAKRDAFGAGLMAATDELSAKDDRTIVFRLKRPFPLLPSALGKTPTYPPVIMPERLAKTDPATQVTEMVGSGPYRFKADERVPGARVVYERFAGYVPRDSGTPDMTAGPKVANFDRIEWTTIPDPTTAAQALINGEQDWWDYATADLMPLLQKSRGVKVVVQEPSGQMSMIRFNHLQPPFNNPAIRRALLGAISQEDVVTAVMGTDKKMWNVPAGIFCPNTPMASDVGLEVFTAPRDLDKVKQDLKDAGYRGEKVVLLAATDFPVLKAMSDVAADTLQRAGMNVEYVATDWGTVVTRRAKKDPVEQGGWSAFCTAWAGADQLNPAGHIALRCNGAQAWFGWPDDPKIEDLRNQWFAAPDLAAQQAICAEIQKQALVSIPYIPMGQYLQPTAYRSNLEGVLNGFAIFWNVKKV